MNMERFFAMLAERGINVHLDDNGALRVKGKKEQLNAAIVAELKAHKTAIAAWLRDKLPQQQDINRASAALPANHLSEHQLEAFAELTLHGLFEVQVVEHPNKVALSFGSQQLTYAQLNLQANRLAYYLRQQGIDAESVIALACAPGVAQVIAVLAVLKAGFAFVPIEAHWHSHTLDKVFNDCEVVRIITDGSFDSDLNALNVAVDDLTDSVFKVNLSECSGANPPLLETQSAYSLACVLYTAGLAGQPKGVMIEHGNLVSVLKWPNYIRFDGSEHWVINHELSSRWALFNLFGALCHGGSLHQFVPGSDQQISILTLCRAQLQLMLTHCPQMLAQVKTLILVEWPEPELFAQLLANLGEQSGRILQVYGAVESGLFVACREVVPGKRQRNIIGQPVAGSDYYVLNEKLEPVATGGEGQLYIGGLVVARGYSDGWQLSEQYFIPSPFSSDPDDNLFATGDWARVLPRGQVEFISRMDNAAVELVTDVKLMELFTLAQTQPVAVVDATPAAPELDPLMDPESEPLISETKLQCLTPTWHSAPLSTLSCQTEPLVQYYLLLMDNFGVGQRLAEQLTNIGQMVICVSHEQSFAKLDDHHIQINPDKIEDHQLLVDVLGAMGIDACHVVHLLSLNALNVAASCEPVFAQFARDQEHRRKGFNSALALYQAFESSPVKLLSLNNVSRDSLNVTGDEPLIPANAMVGALTELSKAPEQHTGVYLLDLEVGRQSPDEVKIAQMSQFIFDELHLSYRPKVVAMRGRQRWSPRLAPTCEQQDHQLNGLQGNYILIADDMSQCQVVVDQLMAADNQVCVVILSQNVEIVNHDFVNFVDTLITDLADFDSIQQGFEQVSYNMGQIAGVIFCPGVALAYELQIKTLLILDSLFSLYPCERALILSTNSINTTNTSTEPEAVDCLANHRYHVAFSAKKHQQDADFWSCVGFDDINKLTEAGLFNRLVAERIAQLEIR